MFLLLGHATCVVPVASCIRFLPSGYNPRFLWFCVNLGAKVLSISDENATICHSDDRREEESEHINVDVFRFFANALNDKNLKVFAASKLTQNPFRL